MWPASARHVPSSSPEGAPNRGGTRPCDGFISMSTARKLVAAATAAPQPARSDFASGERSVLADLGFGVLRWQRGTLVECSDRAHDLLGTEVQDATPIDFGRFDTVDLAWGPDVKKGAVWMRALDDPDRIIEIAPFPRDESAGDGVAMVRDVCHEFAIAVALKEAQDSREAFAYRASHDLLGPARRTRMFCELLSTSDGVEPLKAADFATRAARSAERMTELVHALLEYSRSGNRTRGLNPRALDLAPVVNRALAVQLAARPGQNASIDIDVDAVVLADAEALEHVLAAVLSNALLYCEPHAAPCLRIRSRVFEGSVEVTVEDEGIGIATEHLDKVFAPFERLHAHSTYPGHGLALATARRWTERMDGELELIRSEPGKGATFSIRLPSSEGRA